LAQESKESLKSVTALKILLPTIPFGLFAGDDDDDDDDEDDGGDDKKRGEDDAKMPGWDTVPLGGKVLLGGRGCGWGWGRERP